MILTEYIEYLMTPSWVQCHIQDKFNQRDLAGLTSERIAAVNVSLEHPLVQMTGAVLAGDSVDAQAGYLPHVSVVESNEDEDPITLGNGYVKPGRVTMEMLEKIKQEYADLKEREKEGLISDAQIDVMLVKIQELAAKAGKPPEDVGLLANVERFWIRESYFVSLWCNTLHERQVLGPTLRSVLYAMRKEMRSRNVRDISIRTSKGLVNQNFGRVLLGQESEIAFLNQFWTISVTDELTFDTEYKVVAELILEPHGYPEDQVRNFSDEPTPHTPTDWTPTDG